MFKYHFLTLATILTFLNFLLPAQEWQNGRGSQGTDENAPTILIEGIILDAENGSPLEYATVSLFNQKDSALITGSVTDVAGIFRINSRPGRYYLRVDFIAYKSKFISDVVITQDTPKRSFGAIKVAADTEMLEGVEIVAERSHMEMSLDKRVFHVGKDLANIGGSAADLLENVPSLTVDIDGNVSLRGSGNVRILVDGKPSALTGISSAEAIQSFPANLIERVEVVTNPSVRYDAEGMSGIINIILKKEKKLGWNGNIDISLGNPESYSASINMNYRLKKVNWFGNYSFRYRERLGRGFMSRAYYGLDETNILVQDQTFDRSQISNGFRFGFDYDLDEYNTISSSAFIRPSDGTTDANVNNTNYNGNYDLLSRGLRNTLEDEDKFNFDYNLNYRRTFPQEERLLTMDFKYGRGTETEQADITESILNLDNTNSNETPEKQRTANSEIQEDLIFQIDYVHPVQEKGKFEAGYKGGIRTVGNNYKVEELINGEWEKYGKLTDNFLYEENIQAAYALFGMTVNKFSYQLGVRGEMTMVDTNLKESNIRNEKKYFNLFPTGHFSYAFSEGTSVQVSYSRRIRRPRFWDLNPFFNFVNDQNIRSGNPDLDPELTHSTEIGFIQNWDKASLTSSVYYRYTDNVIQRISTVEITEEGDTVTLSQPQNLSISQSYGLEFVGSYEFFKWWKVDGSVNFFRRMIDGGNLGPEFAIDNYSWFARFNSKFKLKSLDFQMNFNYRAPRESSQGRNKAMYFMDFGLSKDIFKSNATMSVRVRDVFNTRKWRGETYGPNFHIDNEFQWNSRQIMLGFNYRINQRKNRDKRDDNEFDGGEGIN